jgi:serine/threonine protein phosphatase 1
MLNFKWRQRRNTAEARPVAPVVPSDRRCYAVGDIHGRLDLLDDLLGQIRADMERHPVERAFLVFLGDLIDRGPASAQVVGQLRTAEWDWITPVFLLGNHEEAMIAAYDGDIEALRAWTGFGGAETAESYGVSSVLLLRDDWPGFLNALRAAIPRDDIEFLRGFYDQFALGDYLFVHAGVRPGVALDRQNPADLRWIREEFLKSPVDFGKVVVHGHTICAQPELLANRIGIDTGAYRTGLLTALRLDGDDQRVMQTAPAPAA